VNLRMRRTVFLALLALLLLASVARAAGPTQIIRDCADDSKLQGNYSVSDLRNALKHLSGDVDEYSDCRDVISRAIASASSHTSDSGGGGSNGSGGGGSSSSGGGGSHSGGSRHLDETPQSAQDGIVGASTAQDHAAVNEAAIKGAGPVSVNGRSVAPSARMATSFGRNSLPGALLVALVLLGVAALAATAPLVRRRVVAHRQS
jgi:hypothetical protein